MRNKVIPILIPVAAREAQKRVPKRSPNLLAVGCLAMLMLCSCIFLTSVLFSK